MTTPMVSVIIDTYNHASFLEEAVVSALDQNLGGEAEVLVVDDGSTDETPDVVGRFGSRVRYLRKENGGQASAFNVGLEASHGPIVAFLDADDYWLPGKLRKVLDVLETDPNVGAVGHAIRLQSADGSNRVLAPRGRMDIRLHDLPSARAFNGIKALLGTSRFTARRALLARALPVPEILRIEADEWLFTLAAATSEVRILEETLAVYRLHQANLFQTTDPKRLGGKYRALDALALLLPEQLAAVGLPPDVVQAVVRPVRVDANRLGLSLGIHPGSRRAVYQVEREACQLYDRAPGLKGALRRQLSLAACFMLPPNSYYRMRARLSIGREGRVLDANNGLPRTTFLPPLGVAEQC